MRLFIGIELPKSMKAELARVQKEVKQVSTGGRFVPPDNFHITLHFIGESNDLAGAVAAMQEAARGIRPFSLQLGAYGSFDKGTRTSFIRVTGQLDELGALYESLQCSLYDQGFSRDRKRFTPHITLGRNVEYDDLSAAELSRLKPEAGMQAQGIVLFESVRQGGKLMYNTLHREKF